MKRNRLEYAIDISVGTAWYDDIDDMVADSEENSKLIEWCTSNNIEYYLYRGQAQFKMKFKSHQKELIPFFFLMFKNKIIWQNFKTEELYE